MRKSIQKFNPSRALVTSVVEKLEHYSVKGLDDEKGYLDVKEGKKKLSGYRIKIKKYGKKQRQEAIDRQREVLRQEKELLGIIEPTEARFKAELLSVDEEKKKQERLILLPSRKQMMNNVNGNFSDNELLSMDENTFSKIYNELKERKEEFEKEKKLEKQAKARRKVELEKARKEAGRIAQRKEMEKAKQVKLDAEQARKDALAKAQKDHEEAIATLKRENREAQERKKQAEIKKLEKEKIEKEKMESDKSFKDFLAKNGYDENTDIFQRDRKEVRLYRLVNTLKI